MRQECCSVLAGTCCLLHIGLALAKVVKALILYTGGEFCGFCTGSVHFNQELWSKRYFSLQRNTEGCCAGRTDFVGPRKKFAAHGKSMLAVVQHCQYFIL